MVNYGNYGSRVVIVYIICLMRNNFYFYLTLMKCNICININFIWYVYVIFDSFGM